MSKLDYNMLVENINMQMRNNGITQVQLAKVLGIQQSNLSRAIGLNHTSQLTLEQLYDIAEYFGCSIDELMNYNPKEIAEKNLTTQDAAEMIIALMNRFHTRLEIIKRTEESYSPRDKYGNLPPPQLYENEYYAIYFPIKMHYTDYPRDMQKAFAERILTLGNENSENRVINEFLYKLAKTKSIYIKTDFPQEAYDIAIHAYAEKCCTDFGKFLAETENEPEPTKP